MYQNGIPTAEESPTVALWPTAAMAIGMGRTSVYQHAESGDLPFDVLRCGGKLRVATAQLRRLLALDDPEIQAMPSDAGAS
jgi:hypothetical protein